MKQVDVGNAREPGSLCSLESGDVWRCLEVGDGTSVNMETLPHVPGSQNEAIT